MIKMQKKNLKLRTAFFLETLFGIDQFSMAIVIIFFMEYRQFTLSDFFSYLSIIFLTTGLLQIPFSFLSNYFNKKTLIIIGKLFIVIGFAAATFSQNIYYLLISGFLTGLGNSIKSSNFSALLFEKFQEQADLNTHEKDIIRSNSLFLVCSALLVIAGGILAEKSLIFAMLADIALLTISLTLNIILLPSSSPTLKLSFSGYTNFLKQFKKNGLDFIKLFNEKNGYLLIYLAIFTISILMLTRLSFSLYQPLLLDLKWTIKEISIILAVVIFIGGVIGLLLPNYLSRKKQFSTYLYLAFCTIFFSFLLFTLSNKYSFLALFGILIHQIIRGSLSGVAVFYANSLLPKYGEFKVTYSAVLNVIASLSLAIGTSITSYLLQNNSAYFSIMCIHLVIFIILLTCIKLKKLSWTSQ